MKTKKFIIAAFSIVFAVILAMCCTACSSSESTLDVSNQFVTVERQPYWEIVYDKDTFVMYTVSRGTRNRGTFVLMVNPDGSPRIYGEEYSPQLSVDNLYPAVATVIEVNNDANLVCCVDSDGEVWTFDGAMGWFSGDVVALLMDSNGTDIVYDDVIVSTRYCGSVAKG